MQERGQGFLDVFRYPANDQEDTRSGFFGLFYFHVVPVCILVCDMTKLKSKTFICIF